MIYKENSSIPERPNLLKKYIDKTLSGINNEYVEQIGKHVDEIEEKYKGETVFIESHFNPDYDSIRSKKRARELFRLCGAKIAKEREQADFVYSVDVQTSKYCLDHHEDKENKEETKEGRCVIPDAPSALKMIEVGVLYFIKKHGYDNVPVEKRWDIIDELKKIRFEGAVAAVQDNPAAYMSEMIPEAERFYRNLKKTGDFVTVMLRKGKSEKYINDIIDITSEASLIPNDPFLLSETPYEDFKDMLEMRIGEYKDEVYSNVLPELNSNVLPKLRGKEQIKELSLLALKNMERQESFSPSVRRLNTKVRKKIEKDEIFRLKEYCGIAHNIRKNISTMTGKLSGYEKVCVFMEEAEGQNDLGWSSSATQIYTSAEEVVFLGEIPNKEGIIENRISVRGMEEDDFYKSIGQGKREGAGGNPLKKLYGGIVKQPTRKTIENLEGSGFKPFSLKGNMEKIIKIEEYKI